MTDIRVMEFGAGRYGISVKGNALLIYQLPAPLPVGASAEDAEQKAALVLAWHFTDQRSPYVLIRALAAIGMRHQPDELFLTGAAEEEPEP